MFKAVIFGCLLVLAICNSAAIAASPHGPTAITVKTGTVLAGSVADLAADDGHTLDIQAALSRNGRYLVVLEATYPSFIGYLTGTAWTEDSAARCGVYGLVQGQGWQRLGSAWRFNTLRPFTHNASPPPNVNQVRLKCKSNSPYVLRLDSLLGYY
jgi:hypothetical protein